MQSENTPTQVPYSSVLPEDSKLRPKHVEPIPRTPVTIRVKELTNIKRLKDNALWLAIGGLALTMGVCGAFGLIMGPMALYQARAADRAHLAFHGKKDSQRLTHILAWAAILLPTTIVALLLFALSA